MWRDRKDAMTSPDGRLAKALRNELVADHCRAVWLPLPDTADIAGLEEEMLALAPDYAIAWNRRRKSNYDEPTDHWNEVPVGGGRLSFAAAGHP